MNADTKSMVQTRTQHAIDALDSYMETLASARRLLEIGSNDDVGSMARNLEDASNRLAQSDAAHRALCSALVAVGVAAGREAGE